MHECCEHCGVGAPPLWAACSDLRQPASAWADASLQLSRNGSFAQGRPARARNAGDTHCLVVLNVEFATASMATPSLMLPAGVERSSAHAPSQRTRAHEATGARGAAAGSASDVCATAELGELPEHVQWPWRLRERESAAGSRRGTFCCPVKPPLGPPTRAAIKLRLKSWRTSWRET